MYFPPVVLPLIFLQPYEQKNLQTIVFPICMIIRTLPVCRTQTIVVCLRIPAKGVFVASPEFLELMIKLRHRLKNMNEAGFKEHVNKVVSC